MAELILPTSNIFLNCFVLHDHSIFVFTEHCSLGQVTSCRHQSCHVTGACRPHSVTF